MRFNVARLLRESVGTQKTYSIDESFAPQEETQTDHVEGHLRLVRTDAGVWVSGTLQASAHSSCSRCLQEYTTPARLHIDDVYYPTVDVNTGAHLLLPEDAESFCTIGTDHVLDITETVRQYTMIGLPMKPLCRSDCAGLCPECGVNLNEGSCSCETGRVDSRWLPLLNLASNSQGEPPRSY